jgi:hypothetical protein
MVKSAESFDFSQIILRKGKPFRRIICGKSKLSVNYTAERHAFPRVVRRKSKLSASYPAENFSIPRKVKILLFKGLSLLPQIISDEKSTMGDHYYLRFERKIFKKLGVTQNSNLIFRR